MSAIACGSQKREPSAERPELFIGGIPLGSMKPLSGKEHVRFRGRSPILSGCAICKTSWDRAKGVDVSALGNWRFSLCRECWNDSSPQKRADYYFADAMACGHTYEFACSIREAVLKAEVA
jgi:hypothetical protein